MKYIKNEKGASVGEFGLVVGLVLAVAVGAIFATGTSIRDSFAGLDEGLQNPNTLSGTVSAPAFVAPEPAGPDVMPTVVGAGNTTILAGVTEILADVPVEAEVGDVLIAYVMHRSNITAPVGWIEVASEQNGGSAQWTTVFKKVFAPEDAAGALFMQTDSNRMLSHVLAVRGTDPQVAQIIKTNGSSGNSTMDSYFNAADEALIITGTSDVMANTSGSSDITAPAGWTQTTPVSVPNNRLAVAWKIVPVGRGGLGDSGYVFGDNITTDVWSAVQIQITPRGNSVPVNPLYEQLDIGPGYVILGEGDDTYTATGFEDGIVSLDGNDTIIGSDGAETFIPGPGDDTVVLGEGDDTYIFYRGDGSDTLDDYEYFGSNDVLVFPDYASTDLTFINEGHSNMRIYGEVLGDMLLIIDQLEDDARHGMETIQMTDVTLSGVSLRNKMVEDMKPTGTVVGTSRLEHYEYSLGDGSYTITDYDYWHNDLDRLTFTGLNVDDVSLVNIGSNNIRFTMSNGDQITVLGTMDEDQRNDIEEYVFADVTLGQQAIRDKMVEDSKATGTVIGTERRENYFYEAGDGSYTIVDYDFARNDTDTLTFVGINLADVTVQKVGSLDLRFTHIATGDQITVLGTLDEDARNDIEQYIFADGTPSGLDIRNKMVDDMKASGSVVGSERVENYFYTPGDGSFSITDYDFGRNDTDTLTFVGVNIADVLIEKVGSLDIRFTHIATGDQVTVLGTLDGDARNDIEQYIFADGTLGQLAVRNKMVEDMKASGSVSGSERLENYFYTPGDGSYTLVDYDFGRNDSDTLTLSGVNVADVVVLWATNEDLIIRHVATGEEIRILGTQDEDVRNDIEQFIFADVTYNHYQLRNKMVADARALGFTSTNGTERLENYYHTSGDGSYEIFEYEFSRNDNDDLTFTDLASTDVVSVTRSGDDAIITFTGGEIVTINEQFDTSNRHGMSFIRFTDVTWDRATTLAQVQ